MNELPQLDIEGVIDDLTLQIASYVKAQTIANRQIQALLAKVTELQAIVDGDEEDEPWDEDEDTFPDDE